MAVYVNDSQPVWQPFVDLADAKAFQQWPATASSQDQLLQDTIDAACWWAQDFMGRPIVPTEFFQRFNGYSGWGGSMIDLPYSPVLTQDKGYSYATPNTTTSSILVTEYWGNSGGHVLTEQTPQAQGGSDMFALAPNTGIVTRSFQGLLARPTFPGLRNIEVTWWAGYNPIPAHFRRGILRLIKHWWSHDFQSRLEGFQKSEAGGMEHEFFPLIPNDVEQIFSLGSQVGLA